MKKFICNRNGKAVFQEGDRELVAAYQMKSSPVPVTPRKLKAEMEAIARTARYQSPAPLARVSLIAAATAFCERNART